MQITVDTLTFGFGDSEEILSVNHFQFQIFALSMSRFCTVWDKLTCSQPIRMQKLLYVFKSADFEYFRALAVLS